MTIRNSCEQRRADRTRVPGVAAILEFGYIQLVYELIDLSWAGARIRGPKRPPDTAFDILLHVSNRFIECRCRTIWDDQDGSDHFGLVFESQCEPAALLLPTGLLDHRLGIPLKPNFMLATEMRTEGHHVSNLRTN